MKTIYIRISSIFISICLLPFFAIAQNLTKIQKVSLRIPDNTKIDGTAAEWDNKFQCYNNATSLFYTIANDDENLYLIIRAVQPRIILKILNVGVTFTAKENKNAKNNLSITYPLIGLQDGQSITANLGIKPLDIMPGKRPAVIPIFTSGKSDSLVNVANKLLEAKAKEIKIQGIEEIPDSLISIYNEQRIKVAVKFDREGFLTYELIIPLKYFGVSTENFKKFNYSIKLLSRTEVYKKGIRIVYSYASNGEQYDTNQDLDSTTDFSGEYTLAKRP